MLLASNQFSFPWNSQKHLLPLTLERQAIILKRNQTIQETRGPSRPFLSFKVYTLSV